MFTPLGKLLCVSALAGAALAQNLFLTAPTTVTAGAVLLVQVTTDLPSSDSVTELGFFLATSTCPSGCSTPGLGQSESKLLYSGPYNPQSTSAEGKYENISVIIPSWFNGEAEIAAGRFYVQGVYPTPELQFATTTVNVGAGQG